MDTGGFIIHNKTEDFYKDIADDESEAYCVYNEEINKIALSSNDGKRLNFW